MKLKPGVLALMSAMAKPFVYQSLRSFTRRSPKSRGWRRADVKMVAGQAVSDERRRVRSICAEQGITRKRYRRLQKLQRRVEREAAALNRGAINE